MSGLLQNFAVADQGGMSLDWVLLAAMVLVLGAAVQVSFDRLSMSAIQYRVVGPADRPAAGAQIDPRNLAVRANYARE